MRRIAAILLIAALLVAVLSALWLLGRKSLENNQDDVIQVAAERYHVDPALIKAVIWRESLFNPNARGSAGELGLMQLQEIAAQEWADAEQARPFNHEICLDPQTNVLAGTFYLAKLLKRYQDTDDAVPYALADYNAGRSNVLKWNQGEARTNSAAFIDQIGFLSTRGYVIEVMKRASRYRPQFSK